MNAESSNLFNLVENAWIPIADRGLASLREVFASDACRALGGTAREKIALLKLLLAIAQAAATPEDEKAWAALGVAGMGEQCLAYLERQREAFNLYGESPFLQLPAVARARLQPYGAIIPEVAAGNTSVLTGFSVEPANVPHARRALLLVCEMSLALGGKKADKRCILTKGVEKKTAPGGDYACLRDEPGSERQGRKHEDQSVKKDAPGGGQAAVAPGRQAAHQDGIDGPGQSGQQRQTVAQRVKRQRAAVPAHERDTGHGQRKARHKGRPGPGAPEKAPGEQGGEKRGHGHNHAHIGGKGAGQGHVFKQKIEGHARKTGSRKSKLVAPAAHMQEARPHQPERQPAQKKAQQQDFQRREILKQHLGGNKGDAPDKNRGQRRRMPSQLAAGGRPVRAVRDALRSVHGHSPRGASGVLSRWRARP